MSLSKTFNILELTVFKVTSIFFLQQIQFLTLLRYFQVQITLYSLLNELFSPREPQNSVFSIFWILQCFFSLTFLLIFIRSHSNFFINCVAGGLWNNTYFEDLKKKTYCIGLESFFLSKIVILTWKFLKLPISPNRFHLNQTFMPKRPKMLVKPGYLPKILLLQK